jgi:hypothetical protein
MNSFLAPKAISSRDCNPTSHFQFEVGRVAVKVAAAGASVVTLAPALAEFRSQSDAPDIVVQVEWVRSLRENPHPKIFDSGSVWRMYESDTGFSFDFAASTLGPSPYKKLSVDRKFRRAVLQMNGECFADQDYKVDPLEYPLDELLIMHHLTQENGIELHATGMVRPNGDANLFVGHSGAGKSTTTRLWTGCEDVEVLSDDRIIVRREQARMEKGTPRDKQKMRMYGTPWHGEAMYVSSNSAPLERIFVLEHGFGNVITPLTSSQAMAELFARAFVPFHRHEYVEAGLACLQDIVDSVPVYRYAFEPDERAVEKIIAFHD